MRRLTKRARPRGPMAARHVVVASSLALCAWPGQAETVTAAVAANFLGPARALEAPFESDTGHELDIRAASTGQLYAQIVNGAPYDVLLAADTQRPALLAESGLADPETLFTYAIGQLALWTREPVLINGLSLDTLRSADFRWLAIANPEVAPYGAAARQALEALGLWERLQGRVVFGQNIGQAFVMAETGNAELGLVALSHAIEHEGTAAHVIVPSELYEPIRQDAVLLARARDNPAAAALVEYLQGPAAARIIERSGYFRAR